MDELKNTEDLKDDENSKKQEKNGLIYIPRLFLQLGGMLPANHIKDGKQRKLYLIYKYFIYTFYLIFDIMLMVECSRLILQQKEFERISTAFGILVTVTHLWLRSIAFQKNRIPQKFLSLTKTEKSIWESKDREIKDLFKIILKFFRYFNICVFSLSTGTTLLFYVIHMIGSDGLLNIGTKYWNFDKRAFMHEIYFPLDKNKYFYFIFLCNIIFTTLSLIFYNTCQSVLFCFIIFAITRLIILQMRLEKLHLIAKEAQVDCIIIIKKCIKEHQQLIRLVETLNDSTKYLLLLDFLLNSFKVAFNLFKIMTAKSMSDIGFPLFYALMITWEVVAMGWICNEIKVQSLAISDAAYQCLWYEQSEDAKRILNIIIMRARKPLTLTIGPFQPMTTETIVVSLKAAYSYVTIMMDN